MKLSNYLLHPSKSLEQDYFKISIYKLYKLYKLLFEYNCITTV